MNMPDMPPGADTTGANARGPQIIADRTNSALLIVATESEYATIEAAIRKLDILPMQVLIEATIAEVTLNNDLQYGTQFYLANHEGQITLSNAVSASQTPTTNTVTNSQLFPGTLAPNFPGFAIAHTVGSMQFALQALKNITDVQVISAPSLLVLDKQQASFQVGDLVPTITQSAESVITAGAPVVNNVQYQPTGVILTVTPRINSGGLVTLDLEQEVSDVVQTTSSTINSPTFQQRKIKTRVLAQDGETISLAGLISDKKTRGNSGIPLLQEIPLFGNLFSSRTKNSDRTELLILLTPRVVYNLQDARALTEELRRKLSPSRLVP
jgi:general secretion pathway protein D